MLYDYLHASMPAKWFRKNMEAEVDGHSCVKVEEERGGRSGGWI